MSKSKKISTRLNNLFETVEPSNGAPQPGETPPTATSGPAKAPKRDRSSGRTTHPTEARPATSPALTDTLEKTPGVFTLPFRAGDHWNLIQIEDENRPSWREEDRLLVEQITDQLSLALQNAQLFQQTEQQAADLALLNQFGRELASKLNIRDIAEVVYHYTSNFMDAGSFFMAIYKPESDEITFPILTLDGEFAQAKPRKIGNALTDWVIRTGQPLLIEDNIPAKRAELGLELVMVGNDKPALCWLGVPMMLGQRVLGAIVVQSVHAPRLYNERHRDLLLSLASQASIAIQNAQSFEQTEQQNAELAVLNQIGTELSSLQTIQGVAEIIFTYTGKLMDVTDFFVAIYHKETEEISFPLAYIDGNKINLDRQEVGNGLTGQIIKTHQPLYIPDNVNQRIAAMGLDLLNLADESPAMCWLGVPMTQGQEILGIICVQSTKTPRLYNERHRDLLISIANQAAIAIQNSLLFAETQKRASQLQTLNEIGRAVSQQIELKAALQAAYEQLRLIVNVDAFIVALKNEQQNMVDFPMVVDDGVFYEQNSVQNNPHSNTGQVLASGQPKLVLLSDAEYQGLLKEHEGTMGDMSKPSASLLYVPLNSGSKTIGVISIQSYKLRAYDQEAMTLVENVANQIAVSIQNARLFEEARARAEELAVLNDLSRSLSSLLEENEIVRVVYDGIVRLMHARNFYLAMYDEKHKEIIITQSISASVIDSSITRLPLGQGITSHIILTGQSVLIKNGSDNWLIQHGIPPAGEPTASYMGVPLLRGNQVLGAMAIQDYENTNAYNESDLQIFTALASQTSIALENARLFNQTQSRARREQILREITSKVRNTTDRSLILKTAVREIGQALGLKAFIKLESPEDTSPPSQPAPTGGGNL